MFAEPKKIVDRWVGSDPINLHGGVIDTLSYTFKVTGNTLDVNQTKSAKEILADYDSLWKLISPRLKWKDLNNRLLFFKPAFVGELEFEFMLGYESTQKGIVKSALFAFNDGRLEYEHVDH